MGPSKRAQDAASQAKKKQMKILHNFVMNSIKDQYVGWKILLMDEVYDNGPPLLSVVFCLLVLCQLVNTGRQTVALDCIYA